MEERKYDPLSVEELGRNAARAITKWAPVALPPDRFKGEGVYALYYRGAFPAYAGMGDEPIYVGQAVYAAKKPRPLHQRLGEHMRSIRDALNLDLADFQCRWLVLDPIWINLSERLLISEHQPVWNVVVAGFGNHNQGGTRRNQERSWWDTLHPGRRWASEQKPNNTSEAEIEQAVAVHIRRTRHA